MAKKNKQHASVETVGVIDIGTNSLRLAIAEVFADGHIEVLERAALPVPLGQDTFVRRQLSRRSMNSAISALRGFKEILDTYQVRQIRAVATSAVREAANADAFLDRIFMAVGLDIEIIESTEELRLTVEAVQESLGKNIARGYSLLADVGGGSALLAMMHKGKPVASGSYALGSIRLNEALNVSGEHPSRVADMLRHQIGSVIDAADTTMAFKKVRSYIAVGGDARFVAEKLGSRGPNEHVQTVDIDEFDAFVADCVQHSPDELARLHNMPFTDAETLVPALLVLQAILHATNARKMTVTDTSMRDGLLLDMARWTTGQSNTETASSAISSAMTIMEQYQCDVQHAQHVTKLSLRLFDELQSELQLDSRHRLYLEVAALLHEVGGFINGRAHHKHSYYILSNTDIFGLRSFEQQIVANVARYHRRSIPKPSHLPYMALPREHRVIVSKLAAFLRVADALERGHSQQVSDFSIETSEEEVVLHVSGATDLGLERRALQAKGDLFEDIFGLRVSVEEV